MTLEQDIDNMNNITCFCLKCKNKVTMEFDTDCIWGEGMEDEICWSIYRCPVCNENYDNYNSQKPTVKDLIEYNR